MKIPQRAANEYKLIMNPSTGHVMRMCPTIKHPPAAFIEVTVLNNNAVYDLQGRLRPEYTALKRYLNTQ